ncbi:hypothetical protein PFISCL1PPCAC_21821, partial [Pristionchus fissidentatus]
SFSLSLSSSLEVCLSRSITSQGLKVHTHGAPQSFTRGASLSRMQWDNSRCTSRTGLVPSVHRLSQTLRRSQVRVPDEYRRVCSQRRTSKDTSSAQLPVLDRVSESYKVMSESRLLGELCARVPPPHPLEMDEDDFTPIPATPSTFDHANRIFLSAVVHFGSRAFPEFAEFGKEEKWPIVTQFFNRFRLFETGYRADKRFPDDLDRAFSGYTMLVDAEIARNFFPDEAANRVNSVRRERDSEGCN